MKNTCTNTTAPMIRVTRSWGSHGYSIHGVYWERWRDQLSESMSEDSFTTESEKFAFDIRSDMRQMGDGDQRPIFHLKREDAR